MNSRIDTGNNLPIPEHISDAELKSSLLADYKQAEVRANNFPTEIVPLPSKGLVYPEDHPLAAGVVEMKYMTAREEDILTSQNLIKQGVVFDKLFESLLVTKFRYEDLYSGDKNAIMVAARILGYGAEYTVSVDDPFDRNNKQTVTIDLTQIEHKEVDYSLFVNRKNEFDFTLPTSKRIVTFQLPTHGLEQQIRDEMKALKKTISRSGVDRELSTRLKYLILAVDGERGRGAINNFVDNELFAMDSKALRKYIREISPDINMKFTFISETTNETKEMDIPMDVSFFWPDTGV